MNILTWSNNSNNGAFQKPIGTRIFSDMLIVKPTFTFAFTDLQFIEQNSTYTVDNLPMTEEQAMEVATFIDTVVPPFKWYVEVKTHEINQAHDAIVAQIVGSVPNMEVASWTEQTGQAKAWQADNTVATPMIDGLLAGRAIAGETKQILVDKIIANAAAYMVAYSPVLGNLQGKMKTIAAATTAAEVDAIVW